MKKEYFVRVAVLFIIFVAISTDEPVNGDVGGGDNSPDGIFGITPVLERSCIAVKIQVSSNEAVNCIRWYNNDASINFPKILLANGYNELPPNYADGVVVAEQVQGNSEDWTAIDLSSPIASASEALYVIFQLPAFMEMSGEGYGGGPGFGYEITEERSCTFLSPDGDEWVRLRTDNRLMIEVEKVARQPWMTSLSVSGNDRVCLLEETVYPTEIGGIYPNPFNPVATIEFSLNRPSMATLSIYNLRGLLVKHLVNEFVESGHHMIQWHGEDDCGRSVASGVYFARLKADRILETKRLMLVR